MEHFTNEEWIDFANQVAPQAKLEAMRKHLGSGCTRCEEKLAVWQKVRSTAASEAKFQPPAATVRVAKAAFAAAGMGHRQKKAESVIEILFDSLLQPALSGTRSTFMGPRQMLYRADCYQIDVQIEPKPGGNLLVVTGQLMDVSVPEMVSCGAQVKLSDGRGNCVHLVANEFGEFRGEIDNSGDLELSVARQDNTPITISLRHPLGDSPGGKS
jgi:hypothetical protein